MFFTKCLMFFTTSAHASKFMRISTKNIRIFQHGNALLRDEKAMVPPNLFVKLFQFHVFIGKPFRFARIGSLVHLLCRHTRPYFMCPDLGIS